MPVLIKFDKPSIQLGKKSLVMALPDDGVLLDHVWRYMARPHVQEWFKGCRVIWIEGIGEVEMLIEDFV
ncbi:MAG TPA: hypothetical protein VF622_14635 [Segetibacter sp.]